MEMLKQAPNMMKAPILDPSKNPQIAEQQEEQPPQEGQPPQPPQ